MTLGEMLAAAEAKITRLSPAEAQAAMEQGALLVDIRAGESIERNGAVPGAIHVPRTKLEWRFDPEGGWRGDYAGDLDRQVILICDEGCSTILAGGVLADLGYRNVCDVIGGFEAWAFSGSLPVSRTA